MGTGTALNATAGLADYGTRLKAVFNNIPTGVRIFVSTTNVVNISSTTTASLLVAPPGNSTTSFAQLVIGETAPEGSFVPAAGYIYPSNSVTQLNGFAELPVSSTNSATAVWEVINTNPATNENFDFGVWITYTANAAANSPPTGTATVNLSFAPTPCRSVHRSGRSCSLELADVATVCGYVDRGQPLYHCPVHDESVVPVRNQPGRI